MDVFLELLCFGCFVDIQQFKVDIQHCVVYNILCNAARLFKTDITLLL